MRERITLPEGEYSLNDISRWCHENGLWPDNLRVVVYYYDDDPHYEFSYIQKVDWSEE